jgi:hypothetical protein
MTLAARWHAVRAAVDAACLAAGRAPADVTIVAVSKRHPAAAIDEVVAAGALDVGENYAQELVAKQAAVRSTPRWHFIGRLQRNKARLVAGQVALVHAVDSAELGAELGRRAAALGRVQPVLAAINVGGEAQKSGVSPAAAAALVDALRDVAGLRDHRHPPRRPDDDAAARRRSRGAAARLHRAARPARPPRHTRLAAAAPVDGHERRLRRRHRLRRHPGPHRHRHLRPPPHLKSS